MKQFLILVMLWLVFPAQVNAQFRAQVNAQAGLGISHAEVTCNHFRVHASTQHGRPVANVLALCQRVRHDLCALWGISENSSKWEPLCEIVVHSTLENYVTAVGPEAAQTMGCSSIDLQAGKVVRRRIDLKLDENGTLPALAHELTHVVLADRFRGRQTPHWLDEGIAMLADTREKQLLHERDCDEAIASGKAMPLEALMNLQQFSSAEQMPAFYGQSLSLVNMLARERTPQQLIDFAVECVDKGYSATLKKHYGIDHMSQLTARWRAYVQATKQAAPKPLY